jgi:putative PIN family toxin of toxin-antitoxin system
MKVVLDTNVLVSGLINPDGTPAQVLNLVLNVRITILYDNRILREYREVLKRKKFGFDERLIFPYLDYIKNEGEYVVAEPISGYRFIDKDDRMFFEVALTGKARCIVTGNKDHYPNNETITSPKDFIELYLSENEQSRTEAT